jgi:hypothetical protein
MMLQKILQGVPREEAKEAERVTKNVLADVGMEYIRRAVKLLKKKPSAADYESPSWAYKQAHQNGYNQALEDVIKLIEG